jgi:hypothetical protein
VDVDVDEDEDLFQPSLSPHLRGASKRKEKKQES